MTKSLSEISSDQGVKLRKTFGNSSEGVSLLVNISSSLDVPYVVLQQGKKEHMDSEFKQQLATILAFLSLCFFFIYFSLNVILFLVAKSAFFFLPMFQS